LCLSGKCGVIAPKDTPPPGGDTSPAKKTSGWVYVGAVAVALALGVGGYAAFAGPKKGGGI
jgi:hypothetical protein